MLMSIGIWAALGCLTLKLWSFAIFWMIFSLFRRTSVSLMMQAILALMEVSLTKDEFVVKDVLVRANAFDLDHYPLTFKLLIKKTRPKNVQRKVYWYRTGNFKGLQETYM